MQTLIDCDRGWPAQALTELHAYRRMIAEHRHLHEAVYVAFPWCALLEPLCAGREVEEELLEAYRQLRTQARALARGAALLTVCEHREAQRFASLFKACGIRHVFWPYASIRQADWMGLTWHAFPVYPGLQRLVEHGPPVAAAAKPRTAFVVDDGDGAPPGSRLRADLLRLAAARADWRVVQAAAAAVDPRHEQAVVEALAEAQFSVWLAGSRPVRLWQSLLAGAIPVILADDLALPGPVQSWIEACLFLPQSSPAEQVLAAVQQQRERGDAALAARREAIAALLQRHGPEGFVAEVLRLFGGEPRAGAASLLILDPGLKGIGSHHHRINSLLAADARFQTLLVAAHRQLPEPWPAYRAMPVFTHSVYDDRPDLPEEARAQLVSSSAEAIAAVLNGLEQPVPLLVHTPGPGLLQALAAVLAERAAPLTAIGIDLMFEPDAAVGRALTQLGQQCRQRAIPLRLHSSNPIFVAAYQQLLGPELPVGLHPHVLSTGERVCAGERRNTWLLHSGDPRPGKGLEWLAASLAAVLPRLRADLRLLLQIGELRYPQAHPQVAQAIAVIRELAAAWPQRLLLQEGYLANDAWQALLAGVRYAALLHDPAYYGTRTSGNWFDLLPHQADGLRLLLTRGTLTSRLLAEQGLPTALVDYGDTAALEAALNTPEALPPLSGQAGFAELLQWSHGRAYAEHVAAALKP